jgi:competence protein ComEC
VLWPPPGADPDNPNDASVVLLVAVRGVRLLLTGDVEPPSQAALARAWPGLAVDVLKVPHHGSRHQDTAWLTGLGARVAVVSVGSGNDYGHPADEALEPLLDSGADVLRTDLDGDVAVTVEEGELGVATSR